MESINGKVIVVTGGSSGYGKATAKKLTENGAKVIICARKEAELKKTAEEIKCDGYETMDVTDYRDWEKVADLVVKKYGKVDVLVHCAGGAVKLDEIVNQTQQNIDKCILLNLNAVIYGGSVFGKIMKAQRFGTIIDFSSVCSTHIWKTWGVYAAAKCAVENFTKSLYLELQPFGVRVTCLTPAAATTNFLKNCEVLDGPQYGLSPDDIADTVLYVISLPDRAVVEKVTVWGIDQVVDPF